MPQKVETPKKTNGQNTSIRVLATPEEVVEAIVMPRGSGARSGFSPVTGNSIDLRGVQNVINDMTGLSDRMQGLGVKELARVQTLVDEAVDLMTHSHIETDPLVLLDNALRREKQEKDSTLPADTRLDDIEGYHAAVKRVAKYLGKLQALNVETDAAATKSMLVAQAGLAAEYRQQVEIVKGATQRGIEQAAFLLNMDKDQHKAQIDGLWAQRVLPAEAARFGAVITHYPLNIIGAASHVGASLISAPVNAVRGAMSGVAGGISQEVEASKWIGIPNAVGLALLAAAPFTGGITAPVGLLLMVGGGVLDGIAESVKAAKKGDTRK